MAVSTSTQSAGTRDVRVDRPEEGLPGVATVENPTANPPTRASFDAGLPAATAHKQVAQIDTTQTSGLTPTDDVKRGNPSAW